MKPSSLLLILLFAYNLVYSQTSLKGVVTDGESYKPVPYVSIGIIGKPTGTVANIDGAFEINLDNSINDEDTVRFSSIGYQNYDYLVGNLKAKGTPLTINLTRLVNELKPVIVNSKHTTVKILGYDTNSKLFGLGFGTGAIGSEGGVRIPIKHQNTSIDDVRLFIIQNPFDHLTFRVNIYELVDGKPGKNILNENVLIQIENKKTGKIIIDLNKYNIYVNSDVLLTLEWLGATPTTSANLDVGASLFGSTYIRQASQSVWIKKGAGIGLSVKAGY
jgi:hypothetical protein